MPRKTPITAFRRRIGAAVVLAGGRPRRARWGICSALSHSLAGRGSPCPSTSASQREVKVPRKPWGEEPVIDVGGHRLRVPTLPRIPAGRLRIILAVLLGILLFFTA